MENVTDRERNPFGMRPPCPEPCAGGHRAVLGYGDANADFHVVGDHPGVHGGAEAGVPFTGHPAGERLLDALSAVGLVTGRNPLALENAFCSYVHCCCPGPGETPTEREYADFERFFDAELRAIAADVLLPVGERATSHVVTEYTARSPDGLPGLAELHGEQLRGRGFLVVPILDPTEWHGDESEALVAALEALFATEYRQLVDLGRFLPGDDPYLVR